MTSDISHSPPATQTDNTGFGKDAQRPLNTSVPKVPRFNTHDVIRMKANKLVGGYRVWKVTGCVIGSQHTESHYQLQPLDVDQGRNALTEQMDSLVPCWMLETHPLVEKVL